MAWGADLDTWRRQQQQQQDAPAGRRGQGAGGSSARSSSSTLPLLGAQHVAEALREVTEVPETSMVGGRDLVVVVVVEAGACGNGRCGAGATAVDCCGGAVHGTCVL